MQLSLIFALGIALLAVIFSVQNNIAGDDQLPVLEF